MLRENGNFIDISLFGVAHFSIWNIHLQR